MSEPHEIEGQVYWSHDEGHAYGHFHTYDAFLLPGMAAPRKLHLLLPRHAPAGVRLPVLYFNDGNTTFWPGGLAMQSWNVAQTLSEPELLGSLPPHIVVAVCPVDRDRDYTDVEWAPERSCCGLREYCRELSLIKGFVDSHYPAASESRKNTIVGSSHGGTAAFFIATRLPQLFGTAVMMSPAFWVATGYDYAIEGSPLAEAGLILEVAELLRSPTQRPRFWLDWGMVHHGGFHNEVIERLGMLRGRELQALLVQHYGYHLGQDLWVEEDPEGAHDEASWGRRFARLLPVILGVGASEQSLDSAR
ncbi:MAG: alpha/beta hydrolase-fold protein [Myxococcota bacterium]|jgi:hypothetical protein|nr:alpha/beta hydrolase-fold protein [Myxococcota bacterium]